MTAASAAADATTALVAAADLTVMLRQPAQVSDRARRDFVLGTRTHLPGAVVRGAFAARWLAVHHGPPDAGTPARTQFEQLFEGGVRFGPLFAGGPPTPLSVIAHKYPAQPGCGYEFIDRAVHGWRESSCPDCGGAMEPVTAERDPGVEVHRRTHVSIGPEQVARQGMLVTRETLPAGLSFTGTVVADDPRLLDVLAGLGDIQVGGRRTTHGLAEPTFTPKVRLPQPWRRPDGRLVLTLRSPGVFVDDWGRPQRDPNVGELATLLGCPVVVERRWVRWTTVSGWHAASGLPKHTDLAVAAGSTFLLSPAGAVSDDALAGLARRGVGLRRHEGFGDLGVPLIDAPGRIARDADTQRLAGLGGQVAALRTFQTRPVWPALWDLLRRASNGDVEAVEKLRRAAQKWPSPQQQALERFLELAPGDAVRLLDLWGRS